MTASPQVERFIAKLSGVRRSGDGWIAYCPCRSDDGRPTLSVAEGRDGRVLATCHRGGTACDLTEICAALDLELKDLHPHLPDKPFDDKPRPPMDTKLETIYDYTDADGTLVLQVLRLRRTDGGKDFRQRVPDPTQPKGYRYSTSDLGERPLYRLPEVLAAKARGGIIFVVEGEKDVDTLVELGYTATCNPMGADNGKGSKWKQNMTDTLAGCRVIVVADNDEPGLLHANYVATQLTNAGAQVKRKQCPAQHKDITDMITAGGSITDLIEIDEHEERRIDIVRNGRLVTWRDFINETTSDEYDWLIEGMLERGERVMVVATEGAGKTTLARQVAICAGAGINPFTYCKMPAIKTLMIDLENPEKIIRRQSRRILDAINFEWGTKHTVHADLFMKPDGIDILTPHGRELLETQIETSKPELLVIGPIYKSFIDPGNKTSTALITEVTMYFDYLRSRYGCALWLEHHPPLGNNLSGRQIRPADSAVWMRWPEFGFGLTIDPTAPQREYTWEHWRGQRDNRIWPKRLKRGSYLPFEVIEWADNN